MALVRQTCERTGDGTAAIRRRSAVVDRILIEMWRRAFAPLPGLNVALLALGGYGRKDMFPYSDIDVLFAFADEKTEEQSKEAVRTIIQGMWDIGLRASPSSRTVKEAGRFDPDNLEFTLATLDRRFLAGQFPLYQQLHQVTFPGLVLSEWNTITQKLGEIARGRHAKFGNTIFHLEPNLKDCPGGLRDYHLAVWFALLFHLKETKEWPRQRGGVFQSARGDAEAAFDFLAAARCFLHFRHGRDDNTLDWQSQDEAAANSIGLETRGTADPSYWMRTYYRHARVIYRRAALLMEHLPAPVSFYRQFRRRRTPIAGTDFFLDQGRIDILAGAQFNDTSAILRIFSMMATHGYTLSQAAEDRITDALPALAIHIPEGPYLWNALREVLLAPHAAHALRTMHALGILEMLIPEFHGIDALVIRDRPSTTCTDCASRRTNLNSAWRNCCRRSTAWTCFCWPCCCTTRARRGARANTRRRAWNWPTPFWRGWTSTAKSANRFSSSSACTWRCRRRCAATSSTWKTCAALPTRSAARSCSRCSR
jgi:[protein-PII] uridylyltransferase